MAGDRKIFQPLCFFYRRFLVARGLALAAMKSLWWGNGGTKAPPYTLFTIHYSSFIIHHSFFH